MTRPRNRVRDVREDRPATPYLPDGTLDPREWEIACSAACVLGVVVLAGEPWFVKARPIEVYRQGVELEVVVRWLSPEVNATVPACVDGYVVNIVLEDSSDAVHTIH